MDEQQNKEDQIKQRIKKKKEKIGNIENQPKEWSNYGKVASWRSNNFCNEFCGPLHTKDNSAGIGMGKGRY